MFNSTFLGAAAATDCNSKVVPEETHRDPGVGAAGSQPGHTGKGTTILRYYLILKLGDKISNVFNMPNQFLIFYF